MTYTKLYSVVCSVYNNDFKYFRQEKGRYEISAVISYCSEVYYSKKHSPIAASCSGLAKPFLT